LVALSLANRFAFIPAMRLDGSSTAHFLLHIVFPSTGPGLFRRMFESRLSADATQSELWGYGSAFLVASTIGLFAPAYLVLGGGLRRRITAPVLLLPAFCILIFLVMALGLALSDRGMGRPEELLHRPFVWTYFLTAAWVGGAAVLAFQRNDSGRSGRVLQVLIAACALALLPVPAALGSGAQRHFLWGYSDLRVPTGLVRTAEFVRAHGEPQDLAQDAEFDTYYVFRALSERRAYIVRYWGASSPAGPEAEQRAESVFKLRGLRDAANLADVSHRLGIRWFLLRPGDKVSWPPEIVNHPAFESGGFRVYRFD
jgi:hypothetical protein